MVNQWGVQSEEGTRERTPCGVHLRDEKNECLRQKFISVLIDLCMIIFSIKLQIQVGLIFLKCI